MYQEYKVFPPSMGFQTITWERTDPVQMYISKTSDKEKSISYNISAL